VSTADKVVACVALNTATVLAADDRVAYSGHMGAVAVTRSIGFGAHRSEVTSPPVTLGTDILLAGAAVGLEVDDEGCGAIRTRHFGRRHILVSRR
jgi:hypothetical protein